MRWGGVSRGPRRPNGSGKIVRAADPGPENRCSKQAALLTRPSDPASEISRPSACATGWPSRRRTQTGPAGGARSRGPSGWSARRRWRPPVAPAPRRRCFRGAQALVNTASSPTRSATVPNTWAPTGIMTRSSPVWMRRRGNSVVRCLDEVPSCAVFWESFQPHDPAPGGPFACLHGAFPATLLQETG